MVVTLMPSASFTETSCPANVPTEGLYKNYSFGFSVKIPSGLKGMWNSADCVKDAEDGCVCMSDHGRFIPLNETDYIQIYAAYTIDYPSSLGELVRKSFNCNQDHGDEGQFIVTDLHETKLHSFPAMSYRAEYVHDGTTRIHEELVSMGSQKLGQNIMIELDTTEELYPKHLKLYKAIIQSWRPAKRNEW
jgi:hypothetical protein